MYSSTHELTEHFPQGLNLPPTQMDSSHVMNDQGEKEGCEGNGDRILLSIKGFGEEEGIRHRRIHEYTSCLNLLCNVWFRLVTQDGYFLLSQSILIQQPSMHNSQFSIFTNFSPVNILSIVLIMFSV